MLPDLAAPPCSPRGPPWETFVVATPCWAVWLEKLFSLPKLPRGTPKPAELFRNTNLSPAPRPEAGIDLRFTPTSDDSLAVGG